jgi:hypothetical protein
LTGVVGKVDYDLVTKVERENPYVGAVENYGKNPNTGNVANVTQPQLGATAATMQCYTCNGFGHKSRSCPINLANNVSKAFDKHPIKPGAAGAQMALAIGNGGKGDKGDSGKGKIIGFKGKGDSGKGKNPKGKGKGASPF